MKIYKTKTSGCRRLILFFAGWGMDPAPFQSLSRPGYDVAVVWDYRTRDADWSEVDGYDEICLFAWSLGVAAASRLIPESVCRRLTRRVAINGTPVPVSDCCGIPDAVFRGTLANLDERNLMKFRRRMCGDRENYENFCRTLPDRTIEDLADELKAFLSPVYLEKPSFRWDVAVVCGRDAIFPPENQRRAWAYVPVLELDEPHLPDFQSILDRYAIDKDIMAERFSCGRTSYDASARVQRSVAEEMMVMAGAEGFGHAGHVLEIGCGSGLLSRMLAGCCSALELWDIAGPSPIDGCAFREVDAELELPRTPSESFDAIFSASTVQWFNSPARFLAECVRILKPGGILVFSTFLPGNMREIEQSTGRTLPLITAEQWQRMIPDGLELRVMRESECTMIFDAPIDVFRHLRATGVNSLDRDGSIFRAIGAYPRLEDGRCSLTYRPVIFLLRKQ